MTKNYWQLIVMKEKQHGMLSDEEKNQNFNNVGVATVKRKEQNEERKEERKEDMKKVRKKEADQEKEGKANSGVREHKTQT